MSEQPEFKKVPIVSTTAEDAQLEDAQGTETTPPQEETQEGNARDTPTGEISLL